MWRRLVLAAAVGMLAVPMRSEPAWKFFRGMCDASTLEMLNEDLFVTGDDEDNSLRIYSRTQEGLPVQVLSFSQSYGLKKKKKGTQEIDLEGSARIGNRIYWISSHGANAKGKFQPGRHRLFATEVTSSNGVPHLQPVGKLYSDLLKDLLADSRFAQFGFRAAAGRAPKDPNGLNIEGLAPSPNGELLIGFRNPIPGGKALIIPLRNPEEVIQGTAAKFGEARLLDMGGLGVRSITRYEQGYLIVAGPYGGDGASRLYFWDGRAQAPRVVVNRLAGNPEGLAVIGSGPKPTLFMLNDDGTRMVGARECKKVKDPGLKVFRGYELTVEVPVGAVGAAGVSPTASSLVKPKQES